MQFTTRRWILAAVASLMILTLAGGHRAAAQNSVRTLGQALLEFEEAVTWESVSADWRGMREGWIAAVEDARTPNEVAAQLLRLEEAMGWHSVDAWWRGRRPSWVAEMRSARAASTVSRGLLELERATLWSAVSAQWRGQRDPWIARVSAAR